MNYSPGSPTRNFLCLILALAAAALQASRAQASPSITQQPQSQSVLVSSNATFTVAATGQTPLRYQWSLNVTNLANGPRISGATNAALTVSNVVGGDAGNYQAVVTDRRGSVTSAVATLTVLFPPSITAQPTNQSVMLNGSATFTVTATGTAPLFYQWQKNGANLANGGSTSGATNATLTISGVQSNDAGGYGVVAGNAYGVVTSAVATLTVLLPPSIVASPTNQRVLEGNSATFSVTATGTEPLFYQWQKEEIDLSDSDRVSGVTNTTLTISSLQFSDAGAYRAVVSNAYGVATSAVATLTVATNLPPLSGSIGVWGDYDNDGLMDVLLAGTVQGVTNIPDGRFTQLYHNSGAGIFDPIPVSLPQLDNAAAAWGDFNNDGHPDLLLSGVADGTNGPVGVAEVYRNDGSNHFTAINAGLEGLGPASVAWVDYDNDGRLDIFMTGLRVGTTNYVTRLYHNNGDGTFTLAVTNLPAPQNARGYWADYDNDGAADLLLAGSDTTYLLHNEGCGVFANSGLSIPAQNVVVSAWGDYDGDGRLDFITSSGTIPSVIFGPDYHPTFYHNEGNGVFSSHIESSLDMWLFSASWGDIDNSGRACVVVPGWVPLVPGGGVWGSATKVYINLGSSWQEVFTLGGWDNRSETWVDYDGDGDLDIFTIGAGLTTFWNNCVAWHRDFPQPPLNLVVTFTALDEVMLSWQAPANTPTTGRGLSYNVRGGHTPGGVDVVSPMADVATGRRLIPALGNAGAATQWKLTSLPPGTYYWSVQSIGQSFTGSPFAAEGIFTVTSTPPIIVTQPVDQTVYANSNATFAGTAIGTKPLAYQWRKDGVALTNDANFIGAASPVLTISNVQPNLAGAYDVVVNNSYGAITSAVATLEVHGEPRITLQPATQYVVLTRDASFTVAAAGVLPLSYQWYFGGTPLSDGGRLSGATTPTLAIQNVEAGDAGNYWAVVSNAWGSVTSSVVTLNLATARYVNVNNPTPVSPYTNWAMAATGIQDALNIAGIGDEILVTNGVYQSGSVSAGQQYYAGHRIALNKPLCVVSVNGPDVTKIVGGGASLGRRCAYLTNGATLAGFTLTGGETDLGDTSSLNQRGAGVLCQSPSCTVSNCVITGNVAGRCGGGVYSGTLVNCVIANNSVRDLGGARTGDGGGVYAGILRNCILRGNSARYSGGGAASSTLTNCLVAGNSAIWGGGSDNCTLVNCTVAGNAANDDGGLGGAGGGGMSGGTALNSIVVQNSGPYGMPNYGYASLSYSCSSPLPGGAGNIAADPLFVDYAGGNYRLQSNSPCVNAGNNGFITESVDLDGRPRVTAGVVDMGAYEYQHEPWILVSPVSQTVVVTSNATFTVSAIGDAPLAYQWQKDGVNLVDDGRISGATTAALTISPVLVQDGGGYRVIVTNAWGAVTSAVAILTTTGPPSISAQPVSRTVSAGANTSFSVTASGLATLFYQWRLNQTDFPGRTNSSMSLTNVQSANAGDYDVVITNIYGAVTSAVATLTVLPAAPIITTQAVSRVASVGQNVSFTVAAKGTEPILCQWQFNGTNLPGANAFTLTLSNVNSSFSGTYRAALSNDAGFAFSTNVTLVVSPVLIWGFTNTQELKGTGGVLPASATNVVAIAAGLSGSPFPCLALRADGTLVGWGGIGAIPTNAVDVVAMSSGGPGPRQTDNNLALRSDGTVVYWYSASNPALPDAITNGHIVAVAAGGLHQLVLRDDGTVFAWGSNTYGQTNVPASATNVIAIAAGTSHSLALRADGTVVGWGLNTSGQATALSNTVNVVAIAAGGNQSIGLLADGSVVGSIVTNTGPQSLFYGPPPANWTNMTAISAGSYHSLALRNDETIVGWGFTNYGQITPPPYATNVLAIAAGSYHSLALVPDPFAPPIPPRIGRPPVGRAVTAGQSVVFNALGVGGLPLRYQWYRDGVPLAGKTNQWLALTSAHPSEAGDYHLVAMNDFGSATSAVASVSVSIPQPVLVSAARGSNGFSFAFQSVDGVLYVSEYRNALGPEPWIELERRFGSGGTELVTDSFPDAAARFYRVRALFAPSPKLTSASWSGGAVNFNFSSVAGAVYVVQYKDKLDDTAWLELSRQTGTGAPIMVNDPNPPGPSRFYRVRVE